jgi:hypothetical protein
LLGIVPVSMQTPPTSLRFSTTAARRPSFAAWIAARCPAGPLPMQMRSKSYGIAEAYYNGVMADSPLKSSYELAMERLRAKDREAGVEEDAPLTDAQKERIAEMEILHRKNVAGARGDPEATAKVEEAYAIDRGRVESRMESAVAKVRRGEL